MEKNASQSKPKRTMTLPSRRRRPRVKGCISSAHGIHFEKKDISFFSSLPLRTPDSGGYDVNGVSQAVNSRGERGFA
jgi:hypothetical protein